MAMERLGLVALLLNRCSQSLLCYDCYDTGPSNERCVKSKNCTGEACLLYEGEDMLLTTAFCLLNLPNHYRKQNKINDAKCWMERDGKGKHCICSQNFCNHLRDRRIPLQGNQY
uniref:Bm6700 n=1 Tax=Brugia malayi TaxID=6279 RepID=A0A0J9Y8L7_BRUMA|nr:Bm6700 [Brugia malayi]